MPKISEQAKIVRIYLGENSHYQGVPLYHAIVLKAKELGLAGATVFRCLEGFGANSRIKSSRILALSDDLPIVVEIIDNAEYIDKILPFLEEAVREGLVTMDDVKVLSYGLK